jgi:methylase of polypeptide subunit release factors
MMMQLKQLSPEQQRQIDAQIAAYEDGAGVGEFSYDVNGDTYALWIDELVASPRVMNSGIELAKYMLTRAELFTDKVVVDMGCGCGIIGITAALLGAKKVIMSDVDARAVLNTKKNVQALGLDSICTVVQGDLFQNIQSNLRADIQIFNHPYFPASPVVGKDWTHMMLGGTDLFTLYLEQAPLFSHDETVYMFSWIDIASTDDGVDNDPRKRLPEAEYTITRLAEKESSAIGLQQRTFLFFEAQKK